MFPQKNLAHKGLSTINPENMGKCQCTRKLCLNPNIWTCYTNCKVSKFAGFTVSHIFIFILTSTKHTICKIKRETDMNIQIMHKHIATASKWLM